MESMKNIYNMVVGSIKRLLMLIDSGVQLQRENGKWLWSVKQRRGGGGQAKGLPA